MSRQFTPKFESALASKLRPIKSTFKKDRVNIDLPVLPSPMKLGKDGDDHINIYQNSETVLGQALSQSANLGIDHPHFGHFSSLEGFWQWIATQEHDDRLRSLNGHSLRMLAKKLTKCHVPNLQMIVMDACWLKVNRHTELRASLTKSTLPFDCYYFSRENQHLRMRPYYATWMVYGFEEIRKALKEKRDPNFEALREVGEPGTDMYEPFMKMLYGNNYPFQPVPDEEKELILNPSEDEPEYFGVAISTYEQIVNDAEKESAALLKASSTIHEALVPQENVEQAAPVAMDIQPEAA
jgi:hypothetical protein